MTDRTIRLFTVGTLLLLGQILLAAAPIEKNRDKDSDTTKIKNSYTKLFENKKVESLSGLITLHNIEGKLYLEVPLHKLEEPFLFSSQVENVSVLTLSYVGQRPAPPIQILFSKTDSLALIRAPYPPTIVEKGSPHITQAVEESSAPPIIYSTPIVAHTIDSSAIIFDATPFFISDSKYIGKLSSSSAGGFIQKVSNFKKELSLVKKIEAYPNSVSITSDMSYNFTTYFLGMESGGGEPLTVELKSTIGALPKEPYTPRKADYRIGVQVTPFQELSAHTQGSTTKHFAKRWRMEPSELEKHHKGDAVKPKKPIIFYVDTLFPQSWSEAIKKGVLKWNSPFEKIGFKDAIEVYDYPSKSVDSLFDAANIAYNCIRYAQIASRNIVHQINSDPRSGEIIGASILFFRDSPITLQRERILQTALAEPQVRSYKLPDNLMAQSIELEMTRQMGFCLGLTTNMAATSWIPSDSLLSPTFTQKEGITSSVMDQIKYNYFAREEDITKGVALTAGSLGAYDYYAIDWLYSYYPAHIDPQPLLKEKIEEKSGNRKYLYGKE
ncbi:MAG: DUF5117 domain-containing protein, partial [Bacteroidales bacterium]